MDTYQEFQAKLLKRGIPKSLHRERYRRYNSHPDDHSIYQLNKDKVDRLSLLPDDIFLSVLLILDPRDISHLLIVDYSYYERILSSDITQKLMDRKFSVFHPMVESYETYHHKILSVLRAHRIFSRQRIKTETDYRDILYKANPKIKIPPNNCTYKIPRPSRIMIISYCKSKEGNMHNIYVLSNTYQDGEEQAKASRDLILEIMRDRFTYCKKSKYSDMHIKIKDGDVLQAIFENINLFGEYYFLDLPVWYYFDLDAEYDRPKAIVEEVFNKLEEFKASLISEISSLDLDSNEKMITKKLISGIKKLRIKDFII